MEPDYRQFSDRELVALCLRGDRLAERILLDRVFAGAASYLARDFSSLDRDLREDVANETCFIVWERLEELVMPHDGSLRTYARVVAHNLARRVARRWRHESLDVAVGPEPGAEDPRGPEPDCRECLAKFAATLSGDERIVWENAMSDCPEASAALGARLQRRRAADAVRQLLRGLRAEVRGQCGSACK